MDNRRGLDGERDAVLTIEEILNDKELFWRYVLGCRCEFCNAFRLKPIKDSKDIYQIQEEALNSKQNNVRDQRIALLKAKMKKITENPQIDLVEEVESGLKCEESLCSTSEYMNKEKVETKYTEIVEGLKGLIDIWHKKGYTISGYKDKNYGIKFVKDKQEIKYCNIDEQVEKNCVIGATEICVLSEWIKLVNNDVKTHCEVCYGLKKS